MSLDPLGLDPNWEDERRARVSLEVAVKEMMFADREVGDRIEQLETSPLWQLVSASDLALQVGDELVLMGADLRKTADRLRKLLDSILDTAGLRVTRSDPDTPDDGSDVVDLLAIEHDDSLLSDCGDQSVGAGGRAATRSGPTEPGGAS